MNQTDQMDRTYQVAGVTYRLEPLSWQQNKWLGEHIFNGIDMAALDYSVIHDVLREKGPLFMAICLLAEGQSRAQQAQQPFAAIQTLARSFAGELTGGEVGLFGPHFFRFCRPDQLAMLVPGRVLQAAFATLAPSDANGVSGSSTVSSSSPTAISPSSTPSSPDGDPLSLNRSFSEASSAAPLTAPS